MSKITNDGLTRSGTMLYSCTHMATVGVKGLMFHSTVWKTAWRWFTQPSSWLVQNTQPSQPITWLILTKPLTN